MNTSSSAVVLAAGKGTRMGSGAPKVLHALAGRPMLAYVLDHLAAAGFSPHTGRPPVVVIGYRAETVRSALGTGPVYVVQQEQRGTGDAARVALAALPPHTARLLIVHGDEPLIEAETYEAMLEKQQHAGAAIVLLTGEVRDTQGLGRVVRDATGNVAKLVQEHELAPEERQTHEINFGAYVFDHTFLASGLKTLKTHSGGEYYLTDLVATAYHSGVHISTVTPPHPEQQMGINDRRQLRRAENYMCRNRTPVMERDGGDR